jgi:tetratricopeptide (TPR) repeat protein
LEGKEVRHLVLGILLVFACSTALAQEEPPKPEPKPEPAPEEAKKKTEDELKREEEALREAVRQKELAAVNAKIEELEKKAAELRQSGKDPNLLADTEAELKQLREELSKLQAATPKEEKSPIEALGWLSTVEEGMKTAKEKKMNLLVLFTNPENCRWCNELFDKTLCKEKVLELLKTFVLVRIDAWDRGKGQEQAKKYNAMSIPNTVLFDSEGKELGRISGFRPEKQYITEITDIRDAPKKIEEGKKMIEADASDPAGYLQLAKGQLVQGKNDKAKKNFEKVVELDPKNEKGALGEAYEQLAAIYQRSDMDKAIEYATKLQDLDPENKKGLALKAAELLSTLHALKGNQYARQRDSENAKKSMDEAIKYVDKIIELDPENKAEKGYDAAFNLGGYYVRQRDPEKAKKYFDPEKAKKYFDIAKKMDPEDKLGRAENMDWMIAVAPAYQQKWEEAAKGIEKFIEAHGKSELLPTAYWTLADFYRRAGNTEKMEKALDDLVKKFPDSREAQAAKRRLPSGK